MKPTWEVLEHVLGQARVAQGIATVSIATAVLAPLIVRVSGWAGLVGVLLPLVLGALGCLWAMRYELEVRYLPITLLAFTGWATASIVWSRYPLAALGGVGMLLAFGILAVFIALARDLPQIVRACGRVFRVVLVTSIVLEVFAGLIVDSPLPEIGVHGNLPTFGPLQGVFGLADLLALVCVLAGVTFAVEHRMGALTRPWAMGFVAAAVVMLLMTRSAVGFALGGIAVIAFLALELIARAPHEQRRSRQVAVILGVSVLALVVWIARWPLIALLNGVSEALYRLDVWRQLLALFEFNWVIGRGFLGRWNLDVAPYEQIRNVQSRQVPDAASAYLDVMFQLGVVGLVLLALALIAALSRSWLLASSKRAVVYDWPAIVLAVLGASAFAMSNLVFELGWLLFVVCAVKASHQVSWRNALQPLPPVPDENPAADSR